LGRAAGMRVVTAVAVCEEGGGDGVGDGDGEGEKRNLPAVAAEGDTEGVVSAYDVEISTGGGGSIARAGPGSRWGEW